MMSGVTAEELVERLFPEKKLLTLPKDFNAAFAWNQFLSAFSSFSHTQHSQDLSFSFVGL